jgi:hypothetical protein
VFWYTVDGIMFFDSADVNNMSDDEAFAVVSLNYQLRRNNA